MGAPGIRVAALVGRWARHDAAWLMAGEACNRGGRFLLLVLLARHVGPEAFGGWVIAVATGTILANAGDFGLATVTTTRVATDRALAASYVPRLLGAAPLTAVAALGIVFSASPLLEEGTAFSLLAMIALGGTLESAALLLLAPLRGEQQLRPEACLRAGQGIGILAAGACLLRVTGDDRAVALVFAVAGGLSVAAAVATVVKVYRPALPRWDRRWLFDLLRPGLPIFASTLVFFLYFRLDAYLLSYLKGAEETGRYGAAYNVAFGAAFVPAMLGRTIMPRLAAAQTADALRGVLLRSLAITALLAVVLSTLLVSATPLVFRAYGSGFRDALQPFLLLITAQALYCFSHLGYATLVSRSRGAIAWGLTLLALGANAGMNLALIPAFGAPGAALAMILSECVLLVALALVVRPLLRSNTRADLGRLDRQPEPEAKAA